MKKYEKKTIQTMIVSKMPTKIASNKSLLSRIMISFQLRRFPMNKWNQAVKKMTFLRELRRIGKIGKGIIESVQGRDLIRGL